MSRSEHWKWVGLLAFFVVIYAWFMFSLLPPAWAFISLGAVALFVLIPTHFITVTPGEGWRWVLAVLLMVAVGGAGVVYPLWHFARW